jgi:hypothetical protein
MPDESKKWMSREEREVIRTHNNLGPLPFSQQLDSLLDSHDACEEALIGLQRQREWRRMILIGTTGAINPYVDYRRERPVDGGNAYEEGGTVAITPGGRHRATRRHHQAICRQVWRLREQVAELQRDRERLDWLDKQLSEVPKFEWRMQRLDSGGSVPTPIRQGYYSHDEHYPTVREAIDAAMKATAEAK